MSAGPTKSSSHSKRLSSTRPTETPSGGFLFSSFVRRGGREGGRKEGGREGEEVPRIREGAMNTIMPFCDKRGEKGKAEGGTKKE